MTMVNRSASPIDPKLARQLRTAADKVRSDTVRRDDLIRVAISMGATLRAVAEATGLSHSAISLIIKKNQENPK